MNDTCDPNFETIYAFNSQNWTMKDHQVCPSPSAITTLDTKNNTATLLSTNCWGLFNSLSPTNFGGGVYQFSFDIDSTPNDWKAFVSPFFLVRNYQNFSLTNQRHQVFQMELPTGAITEAIFNVDSKWLGKPQTFVLSNFVVTKLDGCTKLPLAVTADRWDPGNKLVSSGWTVKGGAKILNTNIAFSGSDQAVTTPVKTNGYYGVHGIANGGIVFSMATGWASNVTPDSTTKAFFVQVPMTAGDTLTVRPQTSNPTGFQIHRMDSLGCAPPPPLKSTSKTWAKPWMVFVGIGVTVILLIAVIALATRKPKFPFTDSMANSMADPMRSKTPTMGPLSQV